MRFKLIWILLIGAIVFASGCSKENEEEHEPHLYGVPPDPEDLDRSMADEIYGTWKLIDWYADAPQDINNDGQESTDLLSQWNGCFKESKLILSTDPAGKIVYTGISNNPRCPPGFENGDSHATIYWELIEEDGIKYLRFVGDDYYDRYEIIELTSMKLTLKGAWFLTCCDPYISYYTGGYLDFEKK